MKKEGKENKANLEKVENKNKYKALVSFASLNFSMYKGQVRIINDKEVVKDLLKAKYIEEVK